MGMFAGLIIYASLTDGQIAEIDQACKTYNNGVGSYTARDKALSYISKDGYCSNAGAEKLGHYEAEPIVKLAGHGFYKIVTGMNLNVLSVLINWFKQLDIQYLIYSIEDSYFSLKDVERIYFNNISFAIRRLFDLNEHLINEFRVEDITQAGTYGLFRTDGNFEDHSEEPKWKLVEVMK